MCNEITVQDELGVCDRVLQIDIDKVTRRFTNWREEIADGEPLSLIGLMMDYRHQTIFELLQAGF